jgi:PAS domain S-box-containing protein
VHPDDRARVAAAAARQAQGGYDEEYRIRAEGPDGAVRERWIHDRAFPVRGEGGRVVRVVGVAEDVTARKAMELRAADTGRRLAAVIAASPLPIVQSDASMRVTAWNPAAHRLFGWSEAETLGGPLPIVPPEDAEATAAAVAELRAGRSVAREDVPRLRKDGTLVRVDSYVAPLVGEDGAFQGAVAILLDLSAQHEADEHRERARRLEEVAASKTRFLSTAAHELATPLTPIAIQVASLRRSVYGELSPRQRHAVGVIDRNLHRLGSLVQDLLDAARLQGGHLRVTLRPVAPGRLAQEVVDSFADKARQDGVALATSRLESALETMGDETRLGQVLFNLVHNALKFTPRGGRVEVGLRQGDGEVVLFVADTGAGMTEEQMGRLFQPFTQVHDTVAHDVGGTGLGLYISRGLVEQHGGRLTCSSDGRGKGSTFEIHLPLRPVEPPATFRRPPDWEPS